MTKGTCSADQCAKDARTKGMCGMHYQRHVRSRPGLPKDPQARLEILFWAKVEKGPACWEWTACKLKGHGRFGTGYAHRVSYEMANGPIPEGMEIDHTCHNRGCVNPAHLRVVTPKQNNENRAGANPNSKSGVRGVHWNTNAKKWQVTIHAGPKMHHGGYFHDLEDARQAAIELRNKLFTHNDTDRIAA